MQRAFCRAVGWTALVLFVAAPLAAHAQTPYSVSLRPQTFQPLPLPNGGPVQTLNSGEAVDTSFGVTLPFPVTFFDQVYSGDELSVGSNGFITFGPRSSASCSSGQPHCANTWNSFSIPDGSKTPNRLVAVWWYWQRCYSGTMKSQVVGDAPSRALVIEWKGCKNWSSSVDAYWEAQVWLFEGSATIEVHYGETWGNDPHPTDYVVGIADGDAGHLGLGCDKNCGQANWPTHQVITYSQGPELRVTSVLGELEGFAGIRMPVSATIQNNGGEPAEHFTARFWVSPTPSVGNGAIDWFTLDGDVRSLAPGESTTFEADRSLPIDLEEGRYYIVAEADPYEMVPESTRGDNFGVFGPFDVGIRAPNLSVAWVQAPGKVTPGEEFELSWRAENLGNLATADIDYRVTVSKTPFVSPGDLVLGEGRFARMDMGEAVSLSTTVVIPETIESGVYYLGVHLDPDREIFEHDRRDNVGVSQPVWVSVEELEIATTLLPAAHVQGHYSVRLIAEGGDGTFLWRVAEGSALPPGVSLIREISPTTGESATFLRGVPSKRGSFSFTLEAESQGVVAHQDYQLDVDLPSNLLSIVSDGLAQGAFGFPYADYLGAIGGTPPYTWEVVGDLPLGLHLRSDGYLAGTPRQDGVFEPTVVVRDSGRLEASRRLVLEIAPPSELTCVTSELPVLQIGQSVRFPLVAAGGQKDSNDRYTWIDRHAMRLASDLGERGEEVGGPPPGLSLDTGTIRGTPTEFGTYIWNIRVLDAAGDHKDCPVRVDVPADHGLTVVTGSLPNAIAGRSYRASLAASGGEGPFVWSEYADGRILDDLGLSFDGSAIVGTPPLTALEGEADREIPFVAVVRDSKGRVGYRALTLHLLAEAPKEKTVEGGDDGGCQASGGAASPWLLAMLGLVLLRRRR